MSAEDEETFQKVRMISMWLKDKTRPVVLFVGAGMGRDAIPPLPVGRDITRVLANYLNLDDPDKIARDFTLDEVAEWYERATSWADLCDCIVAQIRDDARQPGPAYHIAASLPFVCYATVNYDTVLERALRDSAQRVLSPFNASLQKDKRPVYKVHGTIDALDKNTLILTSEQYEWLLFDQKSGFPLC